MATGPVYVLDTSALVEALASRWVAEGRLQEGSRLLIHRAAIAEVEHEANLNAPLGLAGLQELRRLRELADRGKVQLEYVGQRPPAEELRARELGHVDSLIRELAAERQAVLVTCDRVQAEIARAEGIAVELFEPPRPEVLDIERFFDEQTLSVHLKENVEPYAKRGLPGEFRLEAISGRPLTRPQLEEMARQVVEAVRYGGEGFLESEREGSTIVQYRHYRVVITRPPFSDGWEITAVRPLRRLRLEDYRLPAKLRRRLEARAEGILISGAPGMGKSTFAQALAEFYRERGKVVKTIESPRDLQVSGAITRYSKSASHPGEIHDIILLARPDYTIFDEMRTDPDFSLFADLRLAGVGMVGVVHATASIDAVQRMMGRIELGMLPSIVDTVIFVDRGAVQHVHELRITVKVPSGMRERDLARPVVEVREFLSGRLDYEIYTFGDRTVVTPVEAPERWDPEELVRRELGPMAEEAEVEVEGDRVVVRVPRELATRWLSRQAKRLRRLERRLGLSIVVERT